MSINLHNIDCMEFMRGLPDKAYELAIVDPPYGIGHSTNAGKTAGQQYGKAAAKKANYALKDWDDYTPDKEYFDELLRVSENTIIWGGNYFADLLPASSGWIVWDKDNGDNHFSDCELAWTSFDKALRKFTFTWNGMIQGNMLHKEQRIHPTQKPVALYKWLLKNYAKPGDRILDTHGGSMSIAIACYDLGFELDLCELDLDYFASGQKRLDDHIAKYAPAHERPVTAQGQIKLL